MDGIAEVTQKSAVSPLLGRAQTKEAYADEVNVFRRTLFYRGPPGWSRWWDVAPAGSAGGFRTVIFLRRRDDVGAAALRNFVHDRLVPVTEAAREAFYTGDTARALSTALIPLVAAMHAYDVTKTLAYLEGGTVLDHARL